MNPNPKSDHNQRTWNIALQTPLFTVRTYGEFNYRKISCESCDSSLEFTNERNAS